MNKLKNGLFLGILTGLFVSFGIPSAYTQDSPNSFDGVAIKQAPDLFSCECTLTTDADEELKKSMAADPTIKLPVDYLTNEIVQWKIVHSMNTHYVLLTAKNGLQGEVWVVGKIEVVREPGKTQYFINHPTLATDPYHLDFGKNGFPFALWITASKFDGKVVYKDRNALHFKGESKQAWIDLESRFPLAVREEDRLYSFTILPPPTSPLTVPAAVQNVIQMESRRMQRISAVPPGP